MDRLRWYIIAAVVLLTVFGLGLIASVFGFHRPYSTLFYLVTELTFLPIQVLIVTLVINSLLEAREKSELGQRTNILVGVFFWQMGTDLLRYLSQFDRHLEIMREIVDVQPHWSARDFSALRKRLRTYDYNIDCHCAELDDLKKLLEEKSNFLFGVLTNSSLLENESFTELLWAVGHVSRELDSRTDLNDLPESDYQHLGVDMRRAYIILVSEWLSYVERLKVTQPYSFSLALRLNPFMEVPEPVVEDDKTVQD